MLADHEFQGELSKAGVAIERECATVIAERTGTDAGRDMYPVLAAAAIGAAIRVAMEQWLRADPPVPLPTLLRDALGRLTAGLPDPLAPEKPIPAPSAGPPFSHALMTEESDDDRCSDHWRRPQRAAARR